LRSSEVLCSFASPNTFTARSLHVALPISRASSAWITRSGWSARAIPPIASAVDIERRKCRAECRIDGDPELGRGQIEVVSINERDRKSTRLNSSHQIISYAVFCLNKKKES